jgi:NADH-quinone oxidoreductase subunit A
MLTNYLPALIFIGVACALGLALFFINWFLSVKRPDAAKLSAYECGFPAFEDARLPFAVRFYLVAILFIIFDLETALVFPWAVALKQIGWFGFSSMMIFLFLLLIGFIYEWKKGGLEWE